MEKEPGLYGTILHAGGGLLRNGWLEIGGASVYDGDGVTRQDYTIR
jgi:hypothetical protein